MQYCNIYNIIKMHQYPCSSGQSVPTWVLSSSLFLCSLIIFDLDHSPCSSLSSVNLPTPSPLSNLPFLPGNGDLDSLSIYLCYFSWIRSTTFSAIFIRANLGIFMDWFFFNTSLYLFTCDPLITLMVLCDRDGCRDNNEEPNIMFEIHLLDWTRTLCYARLDTIYRI